MTLTHDVDCAGGIVLYLDQVLVIRQNGNSWSLPKGHVDPGESYEQAARREIAEESGLTHLTLVRAFPTYQRFRLSLSGGDDFTEQKTMHFFLYTTDHSQLAPQESHSEACWMPAAAVSSLLSHPKDRAFYEAQLMTIMAHLQLPVMCHVTYPSTEAAHVQVMSWVKNGVVACAQQAAVTSTYMWSGEIETTSEVLVTLKTFRHQVSKIMSDLSAMHPYETPQCVVVPMLDVSPAYLSWMQNQVRNNIAPLSQ